MFFPFLCVEDISDRETPAQKQNLRNFINILAECSILFVRTSGHVSFFEKFSRKVDRFKYQSNIAKICFNDVFRRYFQPGVLFPKSPVLDLNLITLMRRILPFNLSVSNRN